MKLYFYLLLSFFTFIHLNGQDKNVLSKSMNPNSFKTKRVKERKPDSQKETLISHKLIYMFGIKDYVSASTSIEYERKIKDTPIAWYGSLTIGDLDHPGMQEITKYGKDIININFLHLGGGFHYYPLDYEFAVKPYIGLGGLIGGNRHYRDYFDEESDFIAENGTGFDVGLYGIFGVRWGKHVVRCGLEYRVGYFYTKIFEDRFSTDRHEISLLLSFQF